MKLKNRLLIPVLLVTTLTSFFSCGVDRWAEYAAETELDQWITHTMRENYLWYADIPAEKELNLFLSPDAFLKTILSPEDKGSSYIDTLRQSPAPSYGFDYSLYRVLNNDTAYHALITYILPDSPAAKAGLKRGEWIMQINDELLTKKSESRLLKSGKAVKLTLGKYTLQKEEETDTDIGVVVESGTAEMGVEIAVEDNPVHFHKVITTPKGIKVGYLVYTHFTAGPKPDSQLYNDQLRAISREFSDAGITQFILDLRYNTGGSLACAQLISTLLAPAEALNTPFAHLEYNDKRTANNHTLLYDRSLIGSGANLDIQLGLILTSNATVGIAGSLLNCLSPLGRWGIIGSSVACQGVATEAFINPKYPWSVNPVVCTVLNANEESNRNMSFQPTLAASETTDLLKFLPFGDEKEALLSTAIGVMDGTTPLPDQPKTQSSSIKDVIHTPSRKAPGRTTIH